MRDKIKLQYFWHNVDWGARYLDVQEDGFGEELRGLETPPNELVAALEAFHIRFYPDERIDSVDDVKDRCVAELRQNIKPAYIKKLSSKDATNKLREYDPLHNENENDAPWVSHKALLGYYTEIKKRRSYNKTLTIDVQDLCRKSLADKLATPWLVSWHWRAILPFIRHVAKNDENIVVQLSQIRQWELLLSYRASHDQERPGTQGWWKALSEGKLEKDLLRAPIFGPSFRLRGWDVYRLFMREKILKDIAKEVNRLQKLGLGRTSLEMAYVLGRHDCHFHIEKLGNTKNGKLSEDPHVLDVECEFEIDILPGRTGRQKFFGKEDFQVSKSSIPPDLLSVPAFITQPGGKKVTIKPFDVLFSSDNYCKAIDSLSEVLNDPTARSVLVIAPPGSGKEYLASMAFLCRNRIQNLHKQAFISCTLAGMNVAEARQTLFRFSPLKNQPLVELDTKALENQDMGKCGLAWQATQGALFIDEIDKSKEDVLSMLLRFLESEEAIVPDSSVKVKYKSGSVPLFVFAGSMARRDMFDKSPPDFWTRISHVVEMSHPLDVGDIGSIKRVTKDYVRMFWLKQVGDYFDTSGHSAKDLTNKTLKEQCPGLEDYVAVISPFMTEVENFLSSDNVVDFAASTIAEELVGHGQVLPSVRRIRSIAGRAVFWVTDMLMHSRDSSSAYEFLKKNELPKIERDCQGWFSFLAGLFVDPYKENGSVERSHDDNSEKARFIHQIKEAILRGTVFE